MMSNHIRRFARDQGGAVLLVFAVSLPVFLMVLAFVIDGGLVRLNANRLQVSADAAALAGASQLPDDAMVKTAALEYSDKNYEPVGGSRVLRASDVLTGHWDGSAFEAGAEPKNAVQVVTKRGEANNNPLATLLGAVTRIDSFEIERSAVAVAGGGIALCQNGGLFSNSKLESGSNNDYVANFCIYGADGVKISSDNSFGPGTIVAMNDLRDFEQGGSNADVDDALLELDEPLLLTGLIPTIISNMRAGDFSQLPPFITKGPVRLEEIKKETPLKKGTLYIVDKGAEFEGLVEEIAVVAREPIKASSDSTLRDVVFATPDEIDIGSNIEIGNSEFCNNAEYSVYLFSRKLIKFGSNNSFLGVQMASKGKIEFGSNTTGALNVYGEADGEINYGSNETMGSCATGLSSFFGQLNIAVDIEDLALVQ